MADTRDATIGVMSSALVRADLMATRSGVSFFLLQQKNCAPTSTPVSVALMRVLGLRPSMK
jgi:hypothetical protein